MSISTVPWVVACVTALGFGLLARRTGRRWSLWALAGGFFALIVSTIVWGLGQAASIPYSDHDVSVFHIRWTVEAIIIVAVCGGALFLALRGKLGTQLK